ncbi:S1 family peptidase [Streptomyces sp. NPDC052236]|uniref:S1 family peptidase n=1 Tax=Streptomyces sp. NPDC052236 TaxID=3365686 RepID=UPI0037D78455
MKHRRIFMRKAAVAGGAVLALVAAGATFQSANASGNTEPFTAKSLSAVAAGNLASTLSEDLGQDQAGTYYDARTKSLVVNVVDETAAQLVREAGGTARIVRNTLAELTTVRETLADKATIPGTSWAVNPVTNKVAVTADRTVTGAEWTRLSEVVKGLGAKAELKKSAGELKPLLAGGDAIYAGDARCSVGFNVVKDGEPHFITAGHCGQTGSEWSETAGGEPIGTMVDSQFPGNDFALVKYTGSTPHPSEVNLYDGSSQPITGAGEATIGMEVRRSGSTTQVHEGVVIGLDATVNYDDGNVVHGLIQTTLCAEPGDSGGSLFVDDTALGLTSGGSGDCSMGGETFFQPVPEALSVFGAEIG